MSKIKELEEAQQGYLAAKLAVERTKPVTEVIKITYETEDPKALTGKRIVDAGRVYYDPEKGYVTIIGPSPNGGYDHEVYFSPIAIPFLIKALKELTE
jgi:hypothetical protein